MMCFRDQSFCSDSAQCATKECSVKWTSEQQAAARKWWGDDGAPVAFTSKKDTCGKWEELK